MSGARTGWRAAVAAAFLFVFACSRQPAEPVKWSASLIGSEPAGPGSLVRVRIDAQTARGWYVYSVTQPSGGPVPTRIWLADTTSFSPAGPATGPAPARSYDSSFGIDVEKYAQSPSFELPVRVRKSASTGATHLTVNALYQACNDTICLSPRTVSLRVPIGIQ